MYGKYIRSRGVKILRKRMTFIIWNIIRIQIHSFTILPIFRPTLMSLCGTVSHWISIKTVGKNTGLRFRAISFLNPAKNVEGPDKGITKKKKDRKMEELLPYFVFKKEER